MRFITAIVLAAAVLFGGGCVLDTKSNSDSTKEPTSIKDLTMGGGVFFLEKEGYAFAEFGTFNGINPYDKAKVFVNGLELKNSGGIFTNSAPISSNFIKNGKPVRMVVYALGDSVVKEVALPETPSILQPAADAQLTTGKDLTIEVNYPGTHQIISMALTGQDNVAMAVETAETKLTVTVPGAKLPNEGQFLLTAISSNSAGAIPKDIDVNKQYSIFMVSSMTINHVTFKK